MNFRKNYHLDLPPGSFFFEFIFLNHISEWAKFAQAHITSFMNFLYEISFIE